MRVADYIFSILMNKGIKQAYMLSGGGIMYLVDALGHSGMSYTCCHHEQACSISAQAYSMVNDLPCICLVTTGPGGTNALTGLSAAYMDSTPVIFISGQVKRSDFASLRNVRQFGAQENNIVEMAKPVSKYAVCITNAMSIRKEIEKAYFICNHGRKGPVWLDIPLDVQNEDINPDDLIGYEASEDPKADMSIAVKEVQQMLASSKRPVFLLGHGLKTSVNRGKLIDFLHKIQIPTLTTWRCMGEFDDSDRIYFGSPGLQARRYSNLILQAADCVIILGSRLDNMITAFNEEHFAYNAKKLIIDIDKPEMQKLGLKNLKCYQGYVEDFIDAFDDVEGISNKYNKWVDFCNMLRGRYPILNEKQNFESDKADLYKVVNMVSKCCTKSDTVVVSSTSRCNTAGFIAFDYKKGQKAISSMGLGSMGFAIPSAVGAAQAGNNRVIVLEGDGSLQLNIQELQTIIHYDIEAKIFIFTNSGYAAIATMQDRNFDGFHVGCTEDSGISMPNLERIATAYGFPYLAIHNDDEIEEAVTKVFSYQGPVLCEVFGDIHFDEIPKCISCVDNNGKRTSAYLENPYPFLSKEEMDSIYKLIDNI